MMSTASAALCPSGSIEQETSFIPRVIPSWGYASEHAE
jgi:hypothetical protein